MKQSPPRKNHRVDDKQYSPFHGTRTLIIGVLLSIASLTAPAAFANLINDPGFESGGLGWVFQGAGAGPHSGGHTGSGSAFLNPASVNPSISQDIATTPGTYYLIEFWLAQNSFLHDYVFEVSFAGIIGYSVVAPDPVPLDWTAYSFVALASAATESFRFSGNTLGGTIFIDDVSVTEVPAQVPIPATLWLVAPALVGIGFARRKLPQH